MKKILGALVALVLTVGLMVGGAAAVFASGTGPTDGGTGGTNTGPTPCDITDPSCDTSNPIVPSGSWPTMPVPTATTTPPPPTTTTTTTVDEWCDTNGECDSDHDYTDYNPVETALGTVTNDEGPSYTEVYYNNTGANIVGADGVVIQAGKSGKLTCKDSNTAQTVDLHDYDKNGDNMNERGRLTIYYTVCNYDGGSKFVKMRKMNGAYWNFGLDTMFGCDYTSSKDYTWVDFRGVNFNAYMQEFKLASDGIRRWIDPPFFHVPCEKDGNNQKTVTMTNSTNLRFVGGAPCYDAWIKSKYGPGSEDFEVEKHIEGPMNQSGSVADTTCPYSE